jgi:hypothetical protein
MMSIVIFLIGCIGIIAKDYYTLAEERVLYTGIAVVVNRFMIMCLKITF